jgi:hypothetical protein
MSKAHTPGPWAFINNTLVQDTGNRKHLAEYAEANGLGYEGYANANLITSAPDLLEALQALVAFADNGTPLHPGALVFDDARAAITKATGK